MEVEVKVEVLDDEDYLSTQMLERQGEQTPF